MRLQKILIVDDEPGIVKMLEIILRKQQICLRLKIIPLRYLERKNPFM